MVLSVSVVFKIVSSVLTTKLPRVALSVSLTDEVSAIILVTFFIVVVEFLVVDALLSLYSLIIQLTAPLKSVSFINPVKISVIAFLALEFLRDSCFIKA